VKEKIEKLYVIQLAEYQLLVAARVPRYMTIIRGSSTGPTNYRNPRSPRNPRNPLD